MVLATKREGLPRPRSALPRAKEHSAPAQAWRKSTNYRQWRTAILERDGRLCQFCAAKKNLTAHHIIPAAAAPDLRYAPLNGITLCRACHRALDRAMGDHLDTACSAQCVFVQLLRLMEMVRTTGDRRTIVWHNEGDTNGWKPFELCGKQDS